MGKKNHDLQFVATSDRKGGLILPDKVVKQLKNGGKVLFDGIPYPHVLYKNKKWPIIKTPQGWTIGGKVAEKQHAKNVAAVRAIVGL